MATWAVTTGEELLSLTALEMRAHGSTVAAVTASGRLSDKRERIRYWTLKGIRDYCGRLKYELSGCRYFG